MWLSLGERMGIIVLHYECDVLVLRAQAMKHWLNQYTLTYEWD